jgi:integrase
MELIILCIKSFFKSPEGAFADNTIRAYKSDYAHFAQWCQQNELEPLAMTGEAFAKYVLAMGKNLSTATIRRRIASISSIFKLLEKPDPTKSKDVVLTLKKLHRKLGRAQEQATPLTNDILEKLKEACSDDIVGLRNKVLLQLGYETMRRRSEISAFKFEDVQSMHNGHHAILLRRSKTDQFGEGKLLPISERLYELIREWSQRIQQDHGYILRGFTRDHQVTSSLSPASINKLLKRLQSKSKLDQIDELTGHSFRVGAALDLLEKGMPLERIMLHGGWKSESTAMRYLRNWQEKDLIF